MAIYSFRAMIFVTFFEVFQPMWQTCGFNTFSCSWSTLVFVQWNQNQNQIITMRYVMKRWLALLVSWEEQKVSLSSDNYVTNSFIKCTLYLPIWSGSQLRFQFLEGVRKTYFLWQCWYHSLAKCQHIFQWYQLKLKEKFQILWKLTRTRSIPAIVFPKPI